MRVLHITPEIPGNFSGGKMAVRQTLRSLTENGFQVDYVGPEIPDAEIRGLYSQTYMLEPEKRLFIRVWDTLHGNTNQRYRSWLRLKLDFSIYDAVVMDFTKLDYVLERVPGEKLIVRVHNVEKDYSDRQFAREKTLLHFVEKVFTGRREARIAAQAARLIPLTAKDQERLTELYGVPENRMTIIPICLEHTDIQAELAEPGDTVRMILTGSLWYGPNYLGIKWFLENVYGNLDFPKQLTIAGFRPNEELQGLVKQFSDVRLIDSPESMEPYFKEADLAVAPVFDGAGMKVKVAEALSWGLPVVGTSHAFEGYEIAHGVNSYRAESAEDFETCIRDFYQKKPKQRLEMKQRGYELFCSRYSQENSTRQFGEAVREIAGMKK